MKKFAVLVDCINDHDAFPQIVGPFETKEEAEKFVEHYKEQDANLTFVVAPLCSGGSFKAFMSW